MEAAGAEQALQTAKTVLLEALADLGAAEAELIELRAAPSPDEPIAIER